MWQKIFRHRKLKKTIATGIKKVLFARPIMALTEAHGQAFYHQFIY